MSEKATNAILITIDGLRADHLGCYGYPRDTTPTLDRLAREGALFLQAVSLGGYTPPAFPAIMASAFPPVRVEDYRDPLRGETPLAEVLKEAGYQTAAFGSNVYLSSHFGYNRGFEVYQDYDERLAGGASRRLDKWLTTLARPIIKRNNRLYRLSLDLYYSMVSLKRHPPYMTAGETNRQPLAWLKKAPQKFFLWVHYMDTHPPFMPPEAYSGRFLPDATRTISVRDQVKLSNKWMRNTDAMSSKEMELFLSLYDANIRYVDDAVRDLLDYLRQAGRDRDTVLIVAADHGKQLGDRHRPWRGYTLYEYIIRVPLIVYYPPRLGSAVVRQLVSTLDIAPTIVDMVGVSPPESFRGQSLLPVVEGQGVQNGPVVCMAFDAISGERSFAYRTETWKLIAQDDGKRELYNLASDPEEAVNLWDAERDMGKALEGKIQEYVRLREEERGNLLRVQMSERVRRLKRSGGI